MASIPAANPTVHGGDNADRSYFQKTVCLHDWWLITAENDFGGKRLAVAGVTSREHEARRLFSSAPISKRFDIFTLETVDGICVAIKGFINEQKTIENGFPSEVFSHFVFGFPPHWEQCVEKFFGGDSNIARAGSESTSDSGTESSAPTSVHFDLEEAPHEQLSSEDRHDVEVPNQSSKPSINDAKVDDMPKHTAEEETGRANIGSDDFQSIGRPTNLESSQKKPVFRCITKNKITKSSAASEAIENLGGASGATTQSGEKVDISEEDPRYSLGELFRSLSNLLRSKGKEKQMVRSGLNSERNTVDSVPLPAVSKTASNTLENDNYKGKGRSMSHPSDSELQEPNTVDSVPAVAKTVSNTSQNDNCGVGGRSMSRPSDPELQEPNTVDSVPAVAKTVSNTSQNDNCEVGGRSMSRPSDSELQEPNDVNVIKRLDFDCLEDLQPTCNAKQGLTVQAGEGEIDTITENTSRKKTKRKITNIAVGQGEVDAITEDTSRKRPKRKTTNIAVGEREMDAITEDTSRKKAKRKTTNIAVGDGEMDNIAVGEGEMDAITEDTSRKRTKRKTTNIAVGEGEINAKKENASRKKTRRRTTNVTVGEGDMDAITEDISRKRTKRKTTNIAIGEGEMDNIAVGEVEMDAITEDTSRKKSKSKTTNIAVGEGEMDNILVGEGEVDTIKEDTSRNRTKRKATNIAVGGGEIDAKKENSSRKKTKRRTTNIAVGEGEIDAKKEDTSSKKSKKRTTNIVVGEGEIDAKTENTSRKKNTRKTANTVVGEGEIDAKKENTPRKKVKGKTTFDAEETPTPEEGKKVSIVSPESLNLKRSRTGRLLLPAMEFWRNQAAVYDLDRNITGIQEDRPVVTPSKGCKSGSQKSKIRR